MSGASRRLPRLLARPGSSASGVAPLLLLLLWPLLQPLGAAASCPCQDPALCQPIRNRSNFEVGASRLPLGAWSSNLKESLESN